MKYTDIPVDKRRRWREHMIVLKSHSHIEEFNEWFDEHGERAHKCAWKECHCAK